jgi:hypothetical protein
MESDENLISMSNVTLSARYNNKAQKNKNGYDVVLLIEVLFYAKVISGLVCFQMANIFQRQITAKSL